MERAVLHTQSGEIKNIYLLDKEDIEAMDKEKKTNIKEHLYIGYLVVATAAFGLGLLLTLKKLNGK